MTDLEKVSQILDKLCIEAMKLMEEHIRTKINLELCMCEGETHLAKSRYIMGQNKVSALQLPTEEGPKIEALAVIHSSEDDLLYGQKSFDLEIKKKSSDSDHVHNPIKWFGVLVPRDLHRAQDKYKQALTWCVQSANIQTKLRETIIKIEQLKKCKLKLTMEE